MQIALDHGNGALTSRTLQPIRVANGIRADGAWDLVNVKSGSVDVAMVNGIFNLN